LSSVAAPPAVRLWKTFRSKPNANPADSKNCSPSHRNRRSPSERNRVRLQSGIAFAFDRIPHAAAKFGVEGFSESLSKEVGPLGIKVTIVEPGGFRTDFAGSSTELREGQPEYDATVGATVRFQREYDGKQPGDPIKAAEAILYVASLSEPPLRLLLGSDAYNAAENHTNQTLAADREWKDLSISTDRSF
jgi:NAD(P)-dependent dehydrogenase (short-subunit alcohol dehydrogenase family)